MICHRTIVCSRITAVSQNPRSSVVMRAKVTKEYNEFEDKVTAPGSTEEAPAQPGDDAMVWSSFVAE
jgi:hypothetical protein